MTKHSLHERAQREAECARALEIETAWAKSTPPDFAAKFAASVQAARERGPAERRPNMAPGTPPRPPRPGREPKPTKEESRPKRY